MRPREYCALPEPDKNRLIELQYQFCHMNGIKMSEIYILSYFLEENLCRPSIRPFVLDSRCESCRTWRMSRDLTDSEWTRMRGRSPPCIPTDCLCSRRTIWQREKSFKSSCLWLFCSQHFEMFSPFCWENQQEKKFNAILGSAQKSIISFEKLQDSHVEVLFDHQTYLTKIDT